jgi:hypothetical protein
MADDQLALFLEKCDSRGITYVRTDETSWQIFPELLNITILIKIISLNSALENLARTLKTKLCRQGANIIIDKTEEMRADLYDVLDMQIFLSRNDTVSYPDLNSVDFYYGLKTKEKSMALIGGMVKRLEEGPSNISCHIVSYWKHVAGWKYYGALLSPVPSVPLSFSRPEELGESAEDLIQAMCDSITCFYARKSKPADADLLRECWETIKSKPSGSKTQASIPNQSLKTASAKPQLTSALGRKSARTPQSGKKIILSPPEERLNYFIRPNAAPTPPFYNQNYSNTKNAPLVLRSTFRKPIIRGGQDAKAPIPVKAEENGTDNRHIIQSLKRLEQIIRE